MRFTVPPNSMSCFIGRVDEVDKDFVTNGVLWVDFDDLDGSTEGLHHDEDGTRVRKVYASWTLRSAYAAWENPPIIEYKGELELEGQIEIKDADIEIELPNSDIDISNADINLMNLSISGGPPLQGPCTTPVGPGNATIPVAISAATGSGKCTISANTMGSVKGSDAGSKVTIRAGSAATNNDDSVKNCTLLMQSEDRKKYTIKLVANKQSVSPWCTEVSKENAGEDNSIDDDVKLNRKHFIMDKVNDDHPHGGDKVLCLAFGNSMSNMYAVDVFI